MAFLPFLDADAAHTRFQYLEDLSTGYWFSEVLFASVELKLFDLIEGEFPDTVTLAGMTRTESDGLNTLLYALERMALVKEIEGKWVNSQCARTYLLSAGEFYLGNFLLYRKYMQANWRGLVWKISGKSEQKDISEEGDDYKTRTFNYVRAMDELARIKAIEIVDMVNPGAWHPPILDIGGGAGSLCRGFLRQEENRNNKESASDVYADLLELPEVIEASRRIYPDNRFWQDIRTIKGDFRQDSFCPEKKYGLIILGNFLHAYSADEAKIYLEKALTLLDPNGLILIHDYFPDRRGESPQKGPLYDLNMMLNTYNGRCHQSGEVRSWMENSGIKTCLVRDLKTDSSVIAGSKQEKPFFEIFRGGEGERLGEWVYHARDEGFRDARLLPVDKIVTGSWVRKKCENGCRLYGKNLKCPPKGMHVSATEKMLQSYSYALVIEGEPPGKTFYRKLRSLERKAFLNGFHKVFVFGAGHCPVCEACSVEEGCRYPEKARPSMEGSGIDVYETAKNAGIRLAPVTEKNQYVKYIGLLLLE